MLEELTTRLAELQPVEPADLVEAAPWWKAPGVSAPVLCNVHRGTGEFLGLSDADPSPLEPGEWLHPAFSYGIEAPRVEAGFAALINRDASGWVMVPDHRGATAYSTETGEPRQWQALGDLPEGYTLQKPETAFDTWQDDKWVPDEAAIAEAARRTAYRHQLLANQYATLCINTLQDAVDLDMASEAETAALKAWKVYRVELSRLDINTSAPADDDWPSSPNNEALAKWLASQTE